MRRHDAADYRRRYLCPFTGRLRNGRGSCQATGGTAGRCGKLEDPIADSFCSRAHCALRPPATESRPCYPHRISSSRSNRTPFGGQRTPWAWTGHASALRATCICGQLQLRSGLARPRPTTRPDSKRPRLREVLGLDLRKRRFNGISGDLEVALGLSERRQEPCNRLLLHVRLARTVKKPMQGPSQSFCKSCWAAPPQPAARSGRRAQCAMPLDHARRPCRACDGEVIVSAPAAPVRTARVDSAPSPHSTPSLEAACKTAIRPGAVSLRIRCRAAGK